MKDKIKLLFIPCISTLLGLTISYTLINWLLFIQLELFSLKLIIRNFGIPMVLAGITAWFIVRPRFKILRLELKNGNLRDFYSVMLWIILTWPMIVAQEYLITATGKLTELSSINEIHEFEATKYYRLEKYYVDKQSIGVHTEFEVSGKHNDDFEMDIYIALPIFETEDEAGTSQPLSWLGTKYHKSISNRLEPEEKEEAYKQFAEECQEDFDSKDFSDFVYLDRVENSESRDGYIEAINQNEIYEPSELVFEAVNESFEARNGNKLNWIWYSMSIGSLVWLLMVIIPKIDHEQLERIKAGKPDFEAQNELKDFLGFFILKKDYFITPIVVILNIGIYLLMVVSGLGFISFKGPDLLNWGANFGPMTTSGDWWRLLSSTFLHGGLMHLLANMFGLVLVGTFLEPILGKVKFLMAYLLTGILASIASIWWYEATVSVGASGAIFGMYGVFIAFLLLKVYPPEFAKTFLICTAIFVGYNLLMGLAGGIDNAAHIGGLVSGFVLGFILFPIINRESVKD